MDSNNSFNQEDQKPLLDDLSSQANFNQTKFGSLNKNYQTVSKSPNSVMLDKKLGSNTLETMLKDTASSNPLPQKKERKRKKTETDSSKNMNLSSSIMVSNMQLMPPPSSMVSSNSQMTTSSTSTGNNTYGFIDLEQNSNNSSSINSPAGAALRAITLNVKPSMNTGNVTGKIYFIELF